VNPRPKKPGGPKPTPVRGIRVPAERWEAAKAKADREGRTISAVINDFLERYVQEDQDSQRDA
jgi:predicted DNA-binding protein